MEYAKIAYTKPLSKNILDPQFSIFSQKCLFVLSPCCKLDT